MPLHPPLIILSNSLDSKTLSASLPLSRYHRQNLEPYPLQYDVDLGEVERRRAHEGTSLPKATSIFRASFRVPTTLTVDG